jgi:hypothetical protein
MKFRPNYEATPGERQPAKLNPSAVRNRRSIALRISEVAA